MAGVGLWWWEWVTLSIWWPLCLIYILLITFMDVKHFGIPVTIKDQLRLNGVMNVILFLHTELFLRPICHEWIFPASSLPLWVPRVLYSTQVILKNNIYLIYIPTALNRFTAFYYPVQHQHWWNCNRFRLLFLLVWIISTIFALPAILDPTPTFIRRPDGLLDFGSDNAWLPHGLSFLLSIIAVSVTTVLYSACLHRYRNLKFKRSRNVFECQLFKTSLTAYPPFLIYTVKCLLDAIAGITGDTNLESTVQSTWYWLLDIQTMLPVIPLLICFFFINKTYRHLPFMAKVGPIETKTARSSSASSSTGHTQSKEASPTYTIDLTMDTTVCNKDENSV